MRRDDLETRLHALEARAAVSDLVHRYAVALDERDLDSLGAMFAPDATFDHPGGRAEGRDAVVRMFASRLDAYGLTYHYGHSLGFRRVDPGRTASVLNAHAELVIDGRLHVVALRYLDECAADDDGRWHFVSRSQRLLYVLPHDRLAELAGDPRPIRWPGLEPAEGTFGPLP